MGLGPCRARGRDGPIPPGSIPRLRDLCQALTSVKTATWCWVTVEHPDLRWHAKHHLDVREPATQPAFGTFSTAIWRDGSDEGDDLAQID